MHQYITEYLDCYRNRENVDYAVLISGSWGSGKTYFIKDYLAGAGTEGKDYVYISLNGAQTKQEIDFQIFQQVHPKLCGRGMLIGSRIISSIFRIGTASVSAGAADFEIDPSKIIGEISNVLKSKTALLVLDDIERTVMPTDVLLGYVSEFLSCGVHVILVGAEDQFRNRVSSKGVSYKDVKEKVVGKTFEIPSAIEEIYEDLIGALNVPKLSPLLLSLKTQIIADFKAVPDQCNYRSLKASIRELDFWVSSFPQEVLDSDQFLRPFIQLFVALGYEQQLGNLTAENFGKCSSIIAGDNSKPTEFDQILDRHGKSHDGWFSGDNYLLLPTDLFGRMLFSKAVTREEFADAILALPWFKSVEKRTTWESLWDFYEQEDKDIVFALKALHNELIACKYTRPEEILMVFSVLANLSESRIIAESTDDVVRDARKYTEKILRQGKLNAAKQESYEILSRGYGGHGYPGEFEGKPWFIEIRKSIIGVLARKRRKELRDWIREADTCLNNWNGNFYQRVRTDEDLYHSSIFSELAPKKFFRGFVAMTNHQKREFGGWLQSRFSRVSRMSVDEERAFWSEVSSLCDRCLQKRRSDRWKVEQIQVGVLRNLITKTFGLDHALIQFR